jgi:hypothetical protein
MDWKLCIICQKTKKETLKCPANSKRPDAGAGYDTFVRDAKGFETQQKRKAKGSCLITKPIGTNLAEISLMIPSYSV